VIVEPADSSLVRGTVLLRAEFPGPTPDIEEVEFYVGDSLSYVVGSSPWSVDLDTTLLPPGVLSVVAKATTVLGSVGVSRAVQLHVNNGKPAVSILFPTSGHRVATRGTLVLQAEASDGEEGDLYGDRIAWRSDLEGQIGTDRELWTTDLVPGTHTMWAVATNAWGTSDSVSIAIEVLAQPTYAYCDSIHVALLQECWCIFCHHDGSGFDEESGLELDTYEKLMAGGTHTAQGIYECVYPCKPESSFIYNKITESVPWYGDIMPPPPPTSPFPTVLQYKPHMPAVLWTWISEGAPPDDGEGCQ
jgi:hypothetical protein